MKRILAIGNLIAASIMTLVLLLPAVFSLLAEPIGETGSEAIIGGSRGPTVIFLASERNLLGAAALILLTGLLFLNAHVMWKERKCQQIGAR